MRLANTIVTMSRPSRACVHSDWIVYIALPSPSMQITLRNGQVMAAPIGSGVEKLIEPRRRNRVLVPGGHAVDLAAFGIQDAELVRLNGEGDGIIGFD